ncbi:MAG: nucleotidyltransferase [Phycisphaerae bacterium]
MSLLDTYKKIAKFLNAGKYSYIVIGGLAASTIGEARVTADIDIDLVIEKDDLLVFLDKAKKAGFGLSVKKCIKSAEQTGVFEISYGDYHIDFIIASTDLEIQACNRRKAINLHGVKAFFPTPEDLILLKLVPDRAKDISDIEGLIARHENKLDRKYLKIWAMKLCEEAEDMRIWKKLNKLLGEK